MKLRNILLALLTLIVGNIYAKNEVQTVAQVSSEVTLTDAVDYTITGETPFVTGGSVNIVNTENAVVIIKKHRASAVISNWLKYIKINGVAAKNGENCQVKMYNLGAIIFPYAKGFKPLTCYTEPNFQGTSNNSYTEGSSGGFMKTLNSSTLNNNIRSFKLKRGYMVTFALGTGGWGYSRCFIAAYEDLEIAELPPLMDGRISSYRIFQWYNYGKKGVHDTSAAANAALRTEWCFDWGQGNAERLPDVEWVSHHIYEDWPSAAACGGVTQTPHMQTNNEPGNSADDHPQTVEEVLNNWQNLMRTGMRLCSESSHDGSMNHLKTFIEEIDKRGWRCDILDLHCYWTSGTFNNLTWYSDNYGKGRPIWISEWVWGASWNNNGAWSAGRTDEATYNGTVPILNVLNNNPRVERYAYWNSEADFTKIYRNGKLTKLGEYYAKMETEMGYKPENEFIPRTPPTQAINQDLVINFNKNTKIATLTWSDPNGDAKLDSMLLLCQKPGDTKFTTYAKIALKDQNSKSGASYSYTTSKIEEPGLYTFKVATYEGSVKRGETNEQFINVTSTSTMGLVTYGKFNVTNSDDVNIPDLTYEYETTPAAFFGTPTSNNTFGKTGRVKSQGATEVFYNLYPFVDETGTAKTMTTPEQINFMFITPGEYIIEGKRLIVDSKSIAFAANETSLKHISFETPFEEGVKPVVIANRVSDLAGTTWRQRNNYACEPRITNITNEGFDIEIVRPEYFVTASKGAIGKQTVNYIAMEPGSMYIGGGMVLTAEHPQVSRATANANGRLYRYNVTLGEGLHKPNFFFGATTKTSDDFFTLNIKGVTGTSTDQEGNEWVETLQVNRFYDYSKTMTKEQIDFSEDICYIALSTDPKRDPEDAPVITTGISTIKENTVSAQKGIYDLTGRKLQKAPQSGIYIINNGKNSSKVLKK